MAAPIETYTWDELRDIYEHMKKTIPERPTDPRGDSRIPRHELFEKQRRRREREEEQRRREKLERLRDLKEQRRREWEKRVREAIKRREELERLREEEAAAIRRRDRLNKAKAAADAEVERVQGFEDRLMYILENYEDADEETRKAFEAEKDYIIREINRDKGTALRLW